MTQLASKKRSVSEPDSPEGILYIGVSQRGRAREIVTIYVLIYSPKRYIFGPPRRAPTHTPQGIPPPTQYTTIERARLLAGRAPASQK